MFRNDTHYPFPLLPKDLCFFKRWWDLERMGLSPGGFLVSSGYWSQAAEGPLSLLWLIRNFKILDALIYANFERMEVFLF